MVIVSRNMVQRKNIDQNQFSDAFWQKAASNYKL
jgi:hypothetical protein